MKRWIRVSTIFSLFAFGTLATTFAQEQALDLTNVALADEGYVRVPQSPELELQALTLEVWLLPDGVGIGGTQDGYGAFLAGVIREGQTGLFLAPYGLSWSAGTGQVIASAANQTGLGVLVASSSVIPFGCTVHAAMTFDGSFVRLYLNGNFQGEVEFPYPEIGYFGSDFLIGAANLSSGYWRRFDGQLEEVRLWDHVRTAEDLQQDVYCPLSGSEAGLVAYWDFRDQSLVDQSGNGHDGIAQGPGVGFALPFVDHAPCGQPLPDHFSRGDCNDDGAFDISDAVFGLGVLFTGGGPAPCADACDANDDGNFDISDPVWILNGLFVAGSPPPPEPYPCCGVDPTDDALSCLSSNCP